jgi:endo-1,4-beta-xylanase
MIESVKKFTTKIAFLMMLLFLVSNLKAQIVTNGSFEETALGPVTDTAVKGWLIQVASGLTAAPSFSIVNETAQSGSNSLKVVVNSAGTNSWDIQIVADSLHVVPGSTYKYSVWAKADKANSQIYFTIGNYDYKEYGADRNSKLTTEWKEYTLEFTVNDSKEIIRAPIHFSLAANVGSTIYVDNMKITKVVTPAEAKIPVVIQAESGIVGSNFDVVKDSKDTSITYVTIKTDATPAGATTAPMTADRVITYNVTFPDTGSYDLFARVYVGPETFNDDSFFYGRTFGVKDPATASDWIMVNGLAAAGYSDSANVVKDIGGLGANVWKWVNISKSALPTQGMPWVIKEDSLTQTFQIGGRENGLLIDKFVFGKSNLNFTVDNLNKGLAGTTDDPSGGNYDGPAIAHKQTKFLGNIYSGAQASNFLAYWNQVIPENAGKWASVEGTKDVMNWGELDAAYKLAKDNGLPFNFHVLIWGQQQPAWMENGSLTNDEMLAQITEWFQAVAQRYPAIDILQVVNEPLPGHNPAKYKAALGGDGTTGYDWIVKSFQMARDIFPATTKLMINDYGIIGSTSSTSNYLKIIRLLQSKNLIDAIGVQGHAFTTKGASVTTITKCLDSLSATILPVYVTEMDVDGTDDNVQLNEYKRIFPPIWNHKGIKGITLWGWRRGLWRDAQGAYLVNSNGSERPALTWLREYLDTVVVSVKNDNNEIPQNFELFNNYPNPFNPTTNIKYNVSKTSNVSLKVYDVLGRLVQTLVNDVQNPGQYSVTFNAQNLASGVYFYRLEAGDFVSTKKFILMK